MKFSSVEVKRMIKATKAAGLTVSGIHFIKSGDLYLLTQPQENDSSEAALAKWEQRKDG